MNLIDRTLKDSAWYWAPADKADPSGVPAFADPVLIAPPAGGRWDDTPSVAVTPSGEKIGLNAQFTTRVNVKAGGWLLRQSDTDGADVTGTTPMRFAKAREIHTVAAAEDLRRTATFYQARLK